MKNNRECMRQVLVENPNRFTARPRTGTTASSFDIHSVLSKTDQSALGWRCGALVRSRRARISTRFRYRIVCFSGGGGTTVTSLWRHHRSAVASYSCGCKRSNGFKQRSVNRWLGGIVARSPDSQWKGHGFEYHPRRCQLRPWTSRTSVTKR